MKINLGSREVTPKLRNYMPYELPSSPILNDVGEIVGYNVPHHPFVSVAEGLVSGSLKPTIVSGSFSSADGIAEVATALSSSCNTRTSGVCNPFGDDASALCFAADCTAALLSGEKEQTVIKK